jgi:acetylornithine deacetylase/succinyl-diaminopimelate desuccinylase-like protein
VIGEPTSNSTVIAHKGSLRPWIRVHGVAAHSGTPEAGENAIYKAARFIEMVEKFHHDVIRHRSHPLVGGASLTITRALAGRRRQRVCRIAATFCSTAAWCRARTKGR